VLPHLPEVPVILLSSMDVYRAYELLLADEGGQPVPITEDADVRRGRYPLGGRIEGRDDYDKLDVEPAYLARGGTVLRLGRSTASGIRSVARSSSCAGSVPVTNVSRLLHASAGGPTVRHGFSRRLLRGHRTRSWWGGRGQATAGG
jgi:hypothetical protein